MGWWGIIYSSLAQAKIYPGAQFGRGYTLTCSAGPPATSKDAHTIDGLNQHCSLYENRGAAIAERRSNADVYSKLCSTIFAVLDCTWLRHLVHGGTLVSFQLRSVLLLPSSSSCTCILLSTSPSPDLFSRCFSRMNCRVASAAVLYITGWSKK